LGHPWKRDKAGVPLILTFSARGEEKKANKGPARVQASLGCSEESSTKLAKIFFESRADLRMKEGGFHLGHHVTQLLPHIETLALEMQRS